MNIVVEMVDVSPALFSLTNITIVWTQLTKVRMLKRYMKHVHGNRRLRAKKCGILAQICFNVVMEKKETIFSVPTTAMPSIFEIYFITMKLVPVNLRRDVGFICSVCRVCMIYLATAVRFVGVW
jgi:hypothetical protein